MPLQQKLLLKKWRDLFPFAALKLPLSNKKISFHTSFLNLFIDIISVNGIIFNRVKKFIIKENKNEE